MNAHNTNPVVKRIAIKAGCTFISPALIGRGYGENTDNDVMRYTNGKPFLPGSAVAGVLRALCPSAAKLFGENDRISPLWVYDSAIDGTIIELDGVALDTDNKVALEQKKYDYEAVATGATFTLRLLLTIRGNDDPSYELLLSKLIGALQSGAVAFGAKTRRGFGCVSCGKNGVNQREFDLSPGNIDALKQWLDFDWNSADGWETANSDGFDSDTETLTVDLKLSGSIMIRDTRHTYEDLHTDEDEPDYRHISVNGKPVILGTSWAGAFRSGLHRILAMQYADKAAVYLKAQAYLDEVFGYVTEDDKTAKVSLITFGASVLKKSDSITDGYRSITRVKIDRFTGGAADGALFTEKPWYGGQTTLQIRYPKGRADIQELLTLALEGIDNGLIPIGGESAVGRGFFKVVSINGKPPATQAERQSLIAAIKEAGEPICN